MTQRTLPGRCVRLSAAGLEQHCWQLVQEPLALGDNDTDGCDLEVGDNVVLTHNYSPLGHATKGPLRPGDVGEISKKDAGKVPFQVKFKDHSFWYREGALCKHRVLLPDGLSDW